MPPGQEAPRPIKPIEPRTVRTIHYLLREPCSLHSLLYLLTHHLRSLPTGTTFWNYLLHGLDYLQGQSELMEANPNPNPNPNYLQGQSELMEANPNPYPNPNYLQGQSELMEAVMQQWLHTAAGQAADPAHWHAHWHAHWQ